ncbi:MAG: SUF system NifU family Fe-S cluster assembly protein [Actinomycetes bacterium]
MKLENLYQEIILDHYRHPVGRGLREPYDVEVHHINPTCGDEITLRVRLTGQDDAVRIDDISYDAQGCSISQASTSVMVELLDHASVTRALDLQRQFLEMMQGVGVPDEDALDDALAFSGVAQYPARVKCALLGWMALKDATAQAVDQRTRENA